MCTRSCTPGSCTGQAICVEQGDGGSCFAYCDPTCTGSSCCPEQSQICQPTTPSLSDPGICVPVCAQAMDCNPLPTTNFQCNGGLCACTSDGDCKSSGAATKCDTVSGICFEPCTAGGSTCTASKNGCCVDNGTVSYCDYFGK